MKGGQALRRFWRKFLMSGIECQWVGEAKEPGLLTCTFHAPNYPNLTCCWHCTNIDDCFRKARNRTVVSFECQKKEEGWRYRFCFRVYRKMEEALKLEEG